MRALTRTKGSLFTVALSLTASTFTMSAFADQTYVVVPDTQTLMNYEIGWSATSYKPDDADMEEWGELTTWLMDNDPFDMVFVVGDITNAKSGMTCDEVAQCQEDCNNDPSVCDSNGDLWWLCKYGSHANLYRLMFMRFALYGYGSYGGLVDVADHGVEMHIAAGNHDVCGQEILAQVASETPGMYYDGDFEDYSIPAGTVYRAIHDGIALPSTWGPGEVCPLDPKVPELPGSLEVLAAGHWGLQCAVWEGTPGESTLVLGANWQGSSNPEIAARLLHVTVDGSATITQQIVQPGPD